ncbi:amidohydrolase [Anaeroselena agilis]|uniref:Amidohydrolase n=1 Tax=Anaeroselena agilis TaxID=3063788 RepID=A0ABU3P231_9FIRM|nr:amidohydrolase [Selenomonadales bacterium 4137-cl]
MLALTGGTVLTMAGPALPGGTVLVEGGKIVAVGERVAVPAAATVIDTAGRYVTPGIIDAHTHLGVYTEAYAWAGEEVNETSRPTTPEMDVLDAINPDDAGLADAVAGGVTTVMVAPGSANPVGGQCSIIKTRRRASAEEMLLKRHAGLKIAFGENPRRVYGEQKKAPVTRMATAALVRETLLKAKDYVARAGEKDWRFDLGLEAVARVLRGEMPLRAHAHRADDIVTALRIAAEFGVEVIVEHATEGHNIAELLAARQARLVVGPNLTTRSKLELKDRSFAAPAVLAANGVRFALMSDHPVLPAAFLPVYAGLAVRFGLSEEQALRAITAEAADILGVGERVGRIAAGMDADLVVWDGPPLAVASRPRLVILDGAVGEVDAAQTIAAWRE